LFLTKYAFFRTFLHKKLTKKFDINSKICYNFAAQELKKQKETS